MIEAWTLAAGVGLRPTELANLDETLGRPVYYLGGKIEVHPIRDDLDPADVDRALLTVADVILVVRQLPGAKRGRPG